MAPLNENERREVWEICEDRYQTRSTVLTSQLPVGWYGKNTGKRIPRGIATVGFANAISTGGDTWMWCCGRNTRPGKRCSWTGRRGADLHNLLHQSVRHTVKVPIEGDVIVDVHGGTRPLAHVEAFGRAHRIEMRGESMRKKRNPPQDEKKE